MLRIGNGEGELLIRGSSAPVRDSAGVRRDSGAEVSSTYKTRDLRRSRTKAVQRGIPEASRSRSSAGLPAWGWVADIQRWIVLGIEFVAPKIALRIRWQVGHRIYHRPPGKSQHFLRDWLPVVARQGAVAVSALFRSGAPGRSPRFCARDFPWPWPHLDASRKALGGSDGELAGMHFRMHERACCISSIATQTSKEAGCNEPPSEPT